MGAAEWIIRCAAKLHRRWPSIDVNLLQETAAELYAEDRWRSLMPEQAAEAWLRLGVLAD